MTVLRLIAVAFVLPFLLFAAAVASAAPEGQMTWAALADHMRDVPCVVFALGANNGPAHSVVPASQNLMLAARALGIGSVPTTLHPTVMDCFREMFSIPKDVAFHFCIPLGYPAEEKFGGSVRRPTSETTYLDRWGSPVSWEWLARQSRPDAAFG
jgi:nitroreductase